MNFVDVLKAAGLAVVILIVNVAISFGAVAIYAMYIDPGQNAAYYQTAAQWIAPLSSIAFGWLLFFGAIVILSGKSDRDALRFALAAFGVYAMVDLSVIGAVGQLVELGPTIAVSLASKLVGAVGGVWAARR
jgi:hypothetical protein